MILSSLFISYSPNMIKNVYNIITYSATSFDTMQKCDDFLLPGAIILSCYNYTLISSYHVVNKENTIPDHELKS